VFVAKLKISESSKTRIINLESFRFVSDSIITWLAHFLSRVGPGRWLRAFLNRAKILCMYVYVCTSATLAFPIG